MLAARTQAAALALALLASVSLAQTGEADPPAARPVPGKAEVDSKPKPVLTLEEKRKLQARCSRAEHREDPDCAGIAVPAGTGADADR